MDDDTRTDEETAAANAEAGNEGIPPSPTDEQPPEDDPTASDEELGEGQPEVAGAPTADELGTDKGYIGDKVDPLPNEAHSLESGPDAPSPAEQERALREARVSGEQERTDSDD